MPLPVTRVDITSDPQTIHIPPGGMLVLRRPDNAAPSTPTLNADAPGNLGEWAVLIVDSTETTDASGLAPQAGANWAGGAIESTDPSDGRMAVLWLFSLGAAGGGWIPSDRQQAYVASPF